MIITRVAGTLGGDLERSSAICIPSSLTRSVRPACLLFWRISGCHATSPPEEWRRAPSDECCGPSRTAPSTWRPSTASARGRARRFTLADRRRDSRFRGVVRLAGLSAARDGGRVLDRGRATAPIQAVQASGGGGRGRSSTRLAQKTRWSQSRAWGASAADALRHGSCRRCGLPKIARMPTLESWNRVL